MMWFLFLLVVLLFLDVGLLRDRLRRVEERLYDVEGRLDAFRVAVRAVKKAAFDDRPKEWE